MKEKPAGTWFLYLLRGVYIQNQIPIFHLNMALNYAYILHGVGSAKPRVMTSQSSVNLPKTHLKTAQNSEKHYKRGS